MAKYDIEFFEYFTQAQLEALNSRESQIVELRYGLNGGNPLTLAAIGEVFGVSRERIRQLLEKAYRKIIIKGQKQIEANHIDDACGELLLYVRSIIRPEELDSVNRLIEFSQGNLDSLSLKTHALPLLSYLAYSNKSDRKQNLERAKKILHELASKQRKLILEQNAIAKFSELLTYVIYPKQMKTISPNNFKRFKRQRNVSSDSEGIYGSFYSSKLNRQVQYESGLEQKFLLFLENSKNVAFYQEQPCKIFYEINGNSAYYYPDILFVLEDGRAIVVEIKPIFKMALQSNLTKWSALKAYCQKQGWGLLVTDGQYSIQQIQRHQIKPDFANCVLSRLRRKSLNWTEYKKIKEQFNPNRNDFVALVLNNRLVWRLSPFYLSF